MNILEKIKLGTEVFKDLQVPGADGVTVRLKLISEDDTLQASIAAQKVFKGYDVGLSNIDAYHSEVETQLLYRSLKDPETGNGIANSITDFRQALTPELKEFFALELDALRDEYSPDPLSLSEEDFDKLYKDLKKKPAETLGSVSSISIAKRLVLCLANDQVN